MFQEEFNKLNNIQQQVVACTAENCLVMAAAGTGKTKVISLRAINLIKEGIAPHKILCLTFTNKAAREMENRINAFDPKAAKEMTIRTFHSFCYYLIQNEKKHSRFTFPFTIMDEEDSIDIVNKIVATLPERIDVDGKNIVPHLGNIKRHSLDFLPEERNDLPKIIESYLKETKIYSKILSKYFPSIFSKYNQTLKNSNAVDYMDLIVEATCLLEAPSIRERWNKRYHAIQVDEMQDTSKREYTIIKQIALHNNLCMFGDLNQTIYEWRGSSPFTMTEDFKDNFIPVSFTLEQNYRSTKLLLEAANSYIRNSALEPIYCLCDSTEVGDPIQIILATDKNAEFKRVGTSILKNEVTALSSTAILTRSNGYADDLFTALTAMNIPCIRGEDTKLFRKKEVKQLLAFIDYCVNPRNNYALHKIATHPFIAMDEWLLTNLRKTRNFHLTLHDWFHTEGIDPYYHLFEAFSTNQIVVLDVETTGLNTTKEDIIQIAAIRYGKDGVKDTLDILIKPTKAVGDSYLVHGFSDDLLAEKGISPIDAFKQLLHFIKGKVLVGHNIAYDLQILTSSLFRYQLPAIENPWVYDTLDLAHKIYPKLENHKLATLADMVQTTTLPSHNALDDILATSEVLTHFIEQLKTTQDQRYSAFEQLFPYVAPYSEKIQTIRHFLLQHSIPEGITYLMKTCHFRDYYTQKELETIKNLYRIIEKLYDSGKSIHDNMLDLLTLSALHYTELEQTMFFQNKVRIMTIHQAKGLEYDQVYLVGCNDTIFPTRQSMKSGYLEEEKRLFYVAMTRARRKLYLSYHQDLARSYLVDEIPENFKQLTSF